MAVGLWDSSFKNAFHTLSYRFAAVILVILYSRGKGKELKDAEQGCIADTLTFRVGGNAPFSPINNRKKLIENESKLLEDHRKANKDILTRHFYDMSNMMSRNEGIWLSNGWVKTLLWIFLPCFLYTVISIVYFVASYIDK